MHTKIDEIKKNESKPIIVKNFLDKAEILKFQKLYSDLPVEVDNKRQKILKKKWSINFEKELQINYKNKLKSIIGDYQMDNPNSKDNLESLGLFQESFLPVSLHVDTGFNFNKIINQLMQVKIVRLVSFLCF